MRLIGGCIFGLCIMALVMIPLSESYKSKSVVEQGRKFEVVCIEGYKFIVTNSGYLREKELTPLGGEKCAS